MFRCTDGTCNIIHITESYACVCTNLNELVVCHVSTVKCLLVVHKAWKFGLLDFFATQHQHSEGIHTLEIKANNWLYNCLTCRKDYPHRVCPTKDSTSMSSVSLPASERSGHKPWREFKKGCYKVKFLSAPAETEKQYIASIQSNL